MIDFTLQELSDIVQNIQDEIHDQTGGDEYFFINIQTNGFETSIEFLDIPIWNDTDDMRDFDEDNDCWEPIEGYLRRMINNEIEKLSVIKL